MNCYWKAFKAKTFENYGFFVHVRQRSKAQERMKGRAQHCPHGQIQSVARELAPAGLRSRPFFAVSYTHLTLPTICSV